MPDEQVPVPPVAERIDLAAHAVGALDQRIGHARVGRHNRHRALAGADGTKEFVHRHGQVGGGAQDGKGFAEKKK